MSFNVNVRVDLDEPKIEKKLVNDRFGLIVSTEWKKLIGPYTPRNTGRTEDEAVIEPWRIIYNPVDPISGEHYAQKIYYGSAINFRHTYNPFATFRWDSAAEQAGKKSELYRILNEQLGR